MANPEHLAKLKQGIEAWNEWRKTNPEIVPDLRYAQLEGTDLSEADLTVPATDDPLLRYLQ